jgi:EAL domain-containing protein (putative c-di-GMP-specific phosphodiesterase class I)
MIRFFEGQKWKERLKLLYYLTFSNSALKYFPPDFIVRDPIFSLVDKHRRRGQDCGLILFYLENFHHMFSMYSYSSTLKLQDKIRETILDLLPRYFHHKEVLGIKQFGSDDFCLFIKEHADFTFDELQRKGTLMCREMEKRLRADTRIRLDGYVQFGMGCYVIGPDIESTHAAIRIAYHYARSIATKKLPAGYSLSRQEILQIVKKENISVLVQPIMDLRSGEIFGWEFLTRGPQNTPFHNPMELFEFAYQADLLSKMEFLVFKKACEQIDQRQIKEQVFINLTPVTLSHPLFLDQVLELLKQFPRISPSQIIFEITERHAIRDFSYLGSILSQYRSYGFRFALDDTGAGYSSLQSISELIPDIIKIDKSVIQNIDSASVKKSLLQALMHFAQNINCQVIAEGVERQEEAEVLFDMEVQMGQGFFFAKPAPLVTDQDRLQQLLRAKETIRNSRKITSA